MASRSPDGTFGAWPYSQIAAPTLIQSASLFGLWVISFLIALFAAGSALSIRRRAAAPFAIVSAFAIANAIYGAWQLRQPQGTPIRVAAAARNHDDHASPEQVTAAQAAEVRRLAARGAGGRVRGESGAAPRGAARLRALAAGGSRPRDWSDSRVGLRSDWRAAAQRSVRLTSDGRVRTYTKRHQITGLERGYTVGDAPGLPDDGMAVTICKDLDFQGTLRGDAVAGACHGGLGLMLVPAWDFDADAWMHARMAILRGVEGGYAVACERRPMALRP